MRKGERKRKGKGERMEMRIKNQQKVLAISPTYMCIYSPFGYCVAAFWSEGVVRLGVHPHLRSAVHYTFNGSHPITVESGTYCTAQNFKAHSVFADWPNMTKFSSRNHSVRFCELNF